MGKKQDAAVLSVFGGGGVEETVAEILNHDREKKEEASLSLAERKAVIAMRRKEEARQKKAQEKSQNQNANRIVFLLPATLKEALSEIARWQGTTVSQVATFLLFEAVGQFEQGAINFSDHKRPSYNPRYDFELIHPKDTERLTRNSRQKKKKGWG